MSENNYNNFIGNYDTVRKILKDMYVFGCYRNTDYQKRLGISISAYEKELKRMQFYFQEEDIRKTNISYYRIYGFYYDRYRNDINYLVNSYKLKTYTQKYLQIYTAILQILSSDKEKLFTISELLEIMGSNVEADEKELERKLSNLIEQGLVQKFTEKKRNKYRIVRNPLDGLEPKELLQLYYAADFFSVKFPFHTPAIFLKETIERYMESKHDTRIEKKSLFIYEYNFLHTIFNDIITNELLMAMKENTAVEIEGYKSSMSSEKKKESNIFYPMAILSEYWYGRQYILGIYKKDDKVATLRIDKIKKVTILKEKFIKEKYVKEVEKY